MCVCVVSICVVSTLPKVGCFFFVRIGNIPDGPCAGAYRVADIYAWSLCMTGVNFDSFETCYSPGVTKQKKEGGGWLVEIHKSTTHGKRYGHGGRKGGRPWGPR